MAASGGLITAVNWSIPNIPRFDTVKVPPVTSPAASLPARARPISSLASRATWVRVFRSASRTTGTTSPPSTATAIPTCTRRCASSLSPAQDTFSSGLAASSTAHALTTRSFTLTLSPSPPAWSWRFSSARKPSSSSASTLVVR